MMKTDRGLILSLFLGTMAGFPGAMSWALDPNQPPGSNFDLSHWKLQLPTAGGVPTCTAGSVDEIIPSQLTAGFTNQYFYTGSDGAMVFWAPDNGATTSGSSNPRSELREYINPTTSTANWIPYGTHILDATCKVLQVSAPNKQVIIGQIHAYSSAALPTVKIYYNNGTLSATVKTNSTNDASDKKFTNYPRSGLTSNITYQIKVVNGLVTIVMNNVTNSYDIFQSDPNYTNETQYFKAGSYNQEPDCSNLTDGARVAFTAVTLFHAPSITNQPASQVVTVGSNATFTVGAAGNPPLRYFWKFNGTAIGSNSPTLTVSNVQLTNAGNYSVIITDYVGTVNSVVTSSVAQLTVLAADFSAAPTSGVAPLGVTFTNMSAGQTGLSRWDFGDGTLSTNALSFTRTYIAAGTYTVSLTVTNAGVSSSKTNIAYITVLPPPPTASFTASPTNVVVGVPVNFTDTSTGPPTSWSWDFGDTGTSTAQSPSHTYLFPGNFAISLTVSNTGGASSFVSSNLISVITAEQSWSNAYGVAADSSDADGDGVSNTNEFLTGFNPTNATAFAHIISLVPSGGDMVITYLGASGDTNYLGGPSLRTNLLEYSTGTADGSYTDNFAGAGVSQILSNGDGSGVVTNMVDPGAATNWPSRYYRVRVLVP
jgi:PKD repeat protein